MRNFWILHRVLVRIAGWAVVSFFSQIRVVGGENVPEHGPLIIAATHHNMMLDPAILSSAFPNWRVLHYWSKASLFANPIAKWVLESTGNIPVARKSKDRQVLLRGTFEALGKGYAVALFPEGTSYTEPRIMQIKDGASWAALEYMKWALEHPEKATKDPVVIVPAAIVYTNKSKYRSNVIMEFGPPITIDPYREQFLKGDEAERRAAVKRLTRDLEAGLIQFTINAPDWDTLYVARMARDLLWEDDNDINLDDFVPISQTVVDLFSTPDVTPNFNSVKRYLLEYYSLLQSTNLTNSTLSSLPLPSTLDPNNANVPLPSRLLTLLTLIFSTLAVLIRLPFFLVPFIAHAPAYVMGRLGARLVEDEEETQAQNKIIFGLLFVLMAYPAAFFFLWAMFLYTPIGALASATIVFLFVQYHNKMINDNYEHAKRVVAAWRVLVGVWMPKRWDLSISAISQYTTPRIPPKNPWIDRPEKSNSESPAQEPQAKNVSGVAAEPPVKSRRRRPPSRRLIRHVLRARVQAARALASFFEHLEKGADAEGKWVRASVHLARQFGGHIDKDEAGNEIDGGVSSYCGPTGWRSAREVVAFLRRKGAKIAGLERKVEGEWAATTSGELSPTEESDAPQEEVTWIPAKHPAD
ncbi:glycerol-3-phosphate-acyltransferase [Neolentinus lepideus HHB14362 ss-1]|uniref:Glycerol-3-phosphate-acyltransferase n=1 Tax=Neolentinus lepideus HHB14362 ss-1 TaxID=1314782 RepID=A0A165V3B6_9AGAM|nr:glycerol-3-phosphate-acyltransferase [Neolentinus lepideus HHB14362 ss-1]